MNANSIALSIFSLPWIRAMGLDSRTNHYDPGKISFADYSFILFIKEPACISLALSFSGIFCHFCLDSSPPTNTDTCTVECSPEHVPMFHYEPRPSKPTFVCHGDKLTVVVAPEGRDFLAQWKDNPHFSQRVVTTCPSLVWPLHS